MIGTRPDFTRIPAKRTPNWASDFDFTAHTDAELRRDFEALTVRRNKARKAGMKVYLGNALKMIIDESHYRASVYAGQR